MSFRQSLAYMHNIADYPTYRIESKTLQYQSACTCTDEDNERSHSPVNTSSITNNMFGQSPREESCEQRDFDKEMQDLDALSKKMGMPVMQVNGQRLFGPQQDCTTPPPKGCEVFVGKIPRDCFEPELVPIFEKVGKIYEMRLMMDFSGTNRGYCFVQYHQPAHAQAACKELNHYEIRKGRTIGVAKSVDNCRLFVGGIPKDKTEKEILDEVSRCTEGVVRVIAYSSIADKSKNRGYAFVEYENHKAAAMARRKMLPGKSQMWGITPCFDWADPEPDVQILYVRNLMMNTTEEHLAELFNAVSDNEVEKVKKIKDFAFIHFNSHESAEKAKNVMQGKEIEGSRVDVSWSKPLDKIKAQNRTFIRSAHPPSPPRGYPQHYGNESLTGSPFPYSYNNTQNPGLMGPNVPYGYYPLSPTYNQTDGFHYLTPKLQIIPGYSLNNGASIRNNRNLHHNQNRSSVDSARNYQRLGVPSPQHNPAMPTSPNGNDNISEVMSYLSLGSSPVPGLMQEQMYYPQSPYSHSAVGVPNTNSPHTMYGL